jgi:hypothetical protein
MLQVYRKKHRTLLPSVENRELVCDFSVDRLLSFLEDEDEDETHFTVFDDANNIVLEFCRHENFEQNSTYIIDFLKTEGYEAVMQEVYQFFRDLGGGFAKKI